MTDSLYQRIGQMRVPTKASDVDDTALTLAPLDPARDTLLALLAAAINFELGPAWAKAAAAGTPLTGKQPVSDTWPGPPSPEVLLQRAGSFPMLFLSRDGDGTYEDFSLVKKQLRQMWELHYVLSPLTIGDTRKLQDILVRIGAVVLGTIERKGHPAYQGGAPVLYTSGFATLNIGRTRRGQARFVTGDNAPTYWMFSADIESTEIWAPLDGTSADWLGTGFSVGTGNADGMIQPFTQFDSESYKPPLQPWDAGSFTGDQVLTSGTDTLVTPGGDTLIDA